MYADRFSGSRRFSPTGIGAAVAINGAVVAALIFAAPAVVPIERWKTIPLIHIFPDPPPPPPHPAPRTKSKPAVSAPAPRDANPVVPKPLIDTLVRGPEIDITSGGGDLTDPRITPDPPKPLPPVMVGAQPDPRFVRDLQPPYPPGKRRAGEEGRVTVRVLIGTDGRVKTLEAVGAADEEFLDATRRQALARWRFKPATRDGIPYESWRVMSVRFELND